RRSLSVNSVSREFAELQKVGEKGRKAKWCFNSKLMFAQFEAYMSIGEVQQSLKKGELVEGILRINPRNYEDSYITAPDGEMDIYIEGLHDRNRAMNGDRVAVQIKPPSDWKSESNYVVGLQQDALTHQVIVPKTPEVKGESSESVKSEERTEATITNEAPVDTAPTETTELSQDLNSKSSDDHHTQDSSELPVNTPEPLEPSSSLENDKVTAAVSLEDSGSPEKLSGQAVELNETSSGPIESTEPAGTTTPQSEEVEKSEEPTSREELVETNTQELEDPKSDIQECTEPAGTTTPQSEEVEKSEEPTSREELVETQELEDPKSDIQECTEAALEDAVGITERVPKENTSQEDDKTTALNSETQGQEPEKSVEVVEVSVVPLDDTETSSATSPDSGIILEESNMAGGPVEDKIPEEIVSQTQSDNQATDSSPLNETEEVPILPDPRPLMVNPSMEEVKPEKSDEQSSSSLQGTSSEHSTPVPSSNSDFSKPKRKKKNKNKNMMALGENQKPQAAQEVVPLSSENFMNQTANSNKPQQTEPREIKTKSKKRKSKKKEEAAAAAASNENRAPPALQDSKPAEQPKAKNEVRKNKLARNTQGLKENGNLPMDTWTVEQLMKHPLGEKFLQKTGKVVCILEKKSISLTSGHIKLQNDHNNKWALFVPNDHRFPRMLIPMEQCPTGFYSRPGDFTNVLFLASLVEWGQQETFAKGQLIKSLGNSGEIEAETQALLVENAVDESDFPPEALEGLPLEESWVIPEEEYKRRRDFRKTCVFTIDPSTARDLDDALSCVPLKNGNYEVGVHIADVSFFVKEDTKLDVIAQDRGNSVYLVQKVVPMLPRILCERLCSLNPDSDKLTFSVVWEMTPEGTHVGEAWFGRTVIRSCAQLSYEHAQDLIRGDCSPDSLPPLNGGFTHADVSNAVLNLHSMAVHMRQRRFDSGALRLDQVKLQFALDDFDGMPFGFCALQQKDSHRLVEEFMLYANMAVARQIYDHYPDKALLRRHPSPQARVLNDVVEICESLGIHIDSSSAGSLQKSLMESISSGPEKVPDMLKMAALTSMCTKSMMCALYFCSGCLEDPAEYHHYALNVPLYTHFTSPIRRYPDILVHRLLAASLNYQATPAMSAKEMQVCAEHCNDTKYNARRVSEMSNELFLNLFIKKLGRLSSKGMVMSILDHSFDVLVDKLGVVKRVYCDKLEYGYMRQNGVPQLTIKWKIRGGRRVIQQTLKVFSVVDLSLSPIAPDSLKIQPLFRIQYNAAYDCRTTFENYPACASFEQKNQNLFKGEITIISNLRDEKHMRDNFQMSFYNHKPYYSHDGLSWPLSRIIYSYHRHSFLILSPFAFDSVVECSPATRAPRVRFPADAFYFFFLQFLKLIYILYKNDIHGTNL
ncbi:DIS3L2, partial [Cordylochernes scorpioides]